MPSPNGIAQKRDYQITSLSCSVKIVTIFMARPGLSQGPQPDVMRTTAGEFPCRVFFEH
jgi:hypothetical protein